MDNVQFPNDKPLQEKETEISKLEKKIELLLYQLKNSSPREDNDTRYEMLKELIEEHYTLSGQYYNPS
jgi:hypothetical protein